MKKLLKIKEAVIVEGKYDKITLSNIIDAVIIPTDGFSVFKDESKRKLIRLIAQKNGVVIVTDSDSAGAQIRAFIKNICKDCKITNVYLPQVKGKEKRKVKSSKEGYLGVEGFKKEDILEAFKRSKIGLNPQKEAEKITKTDLFILNLSGGEKSSFERAEFCRFSGIPENISSGAFLDALNSLYSKEEFLKEVEVWRQGADKN